MKTYKVNLDLTVYLTAESTAELNDRIGEYMKTMREESEDFSFDNVCIEEQEDD